MGLCTDEHYLERNLPLEDDLRKFPRVKECPLHDPLRFQVALELTSGYFRAILGYAPLPRAYRLLRGQCVAEKLVPFTRALPHLYEVITCTQNQVAFITKHHILPIIDISLRFGDR